jgi:hypothetical protein
MPRRSNETGVTGQQPAVIVPGLHAVAARLKSLHAEALACLDRCTEISGQGVTERLAIRFTPAWTFDPLLEIAESLLLT